MSVLLFEINEGVGTITLNRPNAFNSVTRELALAFQEALDTCANREDVRSVLITGQSQIVDDVVCHGAKAYLLETGNARFLQSVDENLT